MRLSVILPGYNNPQLWWQRCLQSVQLACESNDEIICVDDGSIKENAFLCDFAREDKRIKVIYRKNGGLSVARNAALAVAKGRYVTFIDSDDEVLFGIFKRCINQLTTSHADIAIYGVRTIWPDIALMKEDQLPSCYYGRLTADNIKVLSNACLLNYAWNKVYSMDFLKKNHLYFFREGMPCEDIIFNLNCVIAGARWIMINEIGYLYYRTQNTLLSCYKPSNFKGLKAGAEAWMQVSSYLNVKDNAWFKRHATFSEIKMNTLEWKNIWQPKSPYSLFGRWKWLRAHPEVGGVKTFIKTFIYTILRRYFYFNCVRRWHIKRMYSNVKKVK